MPLIAGQRIGPYEIVSALGAGGMGEVYRARDTSLGREVAIKVLPPAFAADADRVSRFTREAQTLAALNHPNIAAIFGLESPSASTSQAALVMELLDGETLGQRLTQGALPVRKAIEVAVQVARGLGAAHERGLVHRDLKPDNIFLVRDGQVKILDFGLAKPLGPGAESSAAATETARAMTDPGTVMGTIGYMAPEQVRGHAVDARADLFAFGAVLYEMLSGRRAFLRDTAADTMSAILKEDPADLPGSRPEFSPALDRIIRHCLEKNPAERFQSARDVAFALEALSGSGTAQQAIAVEPPPRARIGLTMAAALGAVVLAGAGYWAGRGSGTTEAQVSVAFTRKTFDQQRVLNARFMPDGKTIVYSASLRADEPEIFVLRPDATAPQKVNQPRTHLLSVSSKGELAVLTGARYIGHRLYRGTLARMPLDGAPRPWLDHVREADWSPDGTTLAIVRYTDDKDSLEYPIGTILYESTGYISDPRVSPDGTRVAFIDHQIKFDDRGWVRVVDGAKRVTTFGEEFWGAEGMAWAPDGKSILFAAAQTAADFQIRSAAVADPSVTRVVAPSPGTMFLYDVSPNGDWIADRRDSRVGLMAKVPDADRERELTWRGTEWGPSLSADGRLLLFTDGSAGANYALAVRRTDGSPPARLGEGNAAGLSPDGKWALATIPSDLRIVIYPTGAGETIRVDTKPLEKVSASWFPDSARILICGSEPGRPGRCYQQPLAGGSRAPVSPEGMATGLVAPDGNAIILVRADGSYLLGTVGGSTAVPVKGLVPGDEVVAWTSDSRGIFVSQGTYSAYARGSEGEPRLPSIDQVDLATGRRRIAHALTPPEAGDVILTGQFVSVANDARWYAYTYERVGSTLFLVTVGKR